jgi:glycosyltransferase involved in cell wall biosynthesis
VRAKVFSKRQFPKDSYGGYPVYRGWDACAGAREVTAQFRPDVVIIQAGKPFPLARAFDPLGVPTLIYLRDAEHLEDEPHDRKARRAFVANSSFVAGRIRERLGVDAAVIPPLIDYRSFVTNTSRHSVTLINPYPEKGGMIALALARARRDVPFEFIESWPDYENLTRLREEASLLPNIQWRRPVLDTKVLYKNTRILIVPSQWEEAWGRVVNEAQASAIPVVASDIGGLPESVGRGGILVSPPGDLDMWRRRLFGLWDDPAEYTRLSAAALERVSQPDLQPERLCSRLLEEICHLVARSTGQRLS